MISEEQKRPKSDNLLWQRCTKGIENAIKTTFQSVSEKEQPFTDDTLQIEGLEEYFDTLPLFINAESIPPAIPVPFLFNYIFLHEALSYPSTISRFWLPLETIKKEARFNEVYINNIEELKNEFIAWRRSRGDGNCYYRAVIASFLLKILHYSSDPSLLMSFKNFLSNLSAPYEEYKESKERLYNFIHDSCEVLRENREKIENIRRLEQNLQNFEFDIDIVRVARLISFNRLSPIPEFLADFLLPEEVEPLKSKILTMDIEAEGLELSLLPLGLGITVHQINLFDKIIISKFPQESHSENAFIVYIICKIKGHYDMLLSIQDMETQNYSVKEASYYFS